VGSKNKSERGRKEIGQMGFSSKEIRVHAMRILLICRYNPYAHIGGSEIFLKNLALELVKLGQKVTILCGAADFNQHVTSGKKEEIDLYEVQPKIRHFEAVDVLASCLSLCKKIIKKSRTDVVINAGAFGVLFNPAIVLLTPRLRPLIVYYAIDSRIGEYLRNKLSWRPQGLSTVDIFRTTTLHYLPLIIAERLSCHLSDVVLASSVDTLNTLKEHCKLPAEKGEVLYLGLPDNFAVGFEPQEPTTPTFLHVATRTERKGTRFFLLALKKLHDHYGLESHGIVVGSRDQYYVAMTQRLGLNVVFTGWVPHDTCELKRYYASCTSLVSPSISEGFCLPVIEAASFNKPSIVSNAGSLPELVRDGVDGYVVPVADIDALTERMYNLATDDELRRRMSIRAREKAEKFKISLVAQNALHIIRKAIDKLR